MSSQENLIKDLHTLWNNFLKEEDDNRKIPWIQLFLYKFESLNHYNLSIGSSTFFNSVGYKLTCFMLRMIMSIICESHSNNDDAAMSASDPSSDIQDYESSDQMFPQANISEPSEYSSEANNISKILSRNEITTEITTTNGLREFLTHGIGGKILEFLQNCDIKFLTSRQIFSKLMINLFPNCSWDNNTSEVLISQMKNYSPPLSINTFAQEFSLIEVTQKKNVSHKKIHQFINSNLPYEKIRSFFNERDTSLPIFDDDDLDNHEITEVDYDKEDFEIFLQHSKTSDQIAYLILNLLIIVTKDEVGLNLDASSITWNCLNFVLKAINTIDEITQISDNSNLLKLKCLNLIEVCLNNFTVNPNNYALIDYRKIFIQIYKAFRSITYIDPLTRPHIMVAKERIEFTLGTVYITFGLLNNYIVTLKEDERIKLLKSIENRPFTIMIETLKVCMVLNQSHLKYYKKFLELQFKIISNIKLLNNSSKKKRKIDKTRPAKKRTSKKKNKNFQPIQTHCKENKLPCLFEGIIMNLFGFLPMDTQEVLLKQFQKNAACCCIYSLTTLVKLLLNNYSFIIQKKVYKFIELRFLKTICTKNQCKLCEEKKKSFEFHENLFVIYKQKFLSYNRTSAALLIYLKHLLKVFHLISYEIGSKIIIDIALPIFRDKKNYLMDHGSNFNEYDDENKNKYLSSLNIILECIHIFISYLNDVRLIKSFFNTENIEHLADLIVIPELLKAIFDLIKIGLENSTYLGYNDDERIFLNNKLIVLQLNSVEFSTFIIMDLIKDLNFPVYEIEYISNVELIKKLNPINNLYTNKKLTISQILYMTTINWNLVADLYKSNKEYRENFCQKYSKTDHNNENADENNIIKQDFLFVIVYNVFNTFLYYKYKFPIESSTEKVSNINVLQMVLSIQNITDYNFVELYENIDFHTRLRNMPGIKYCSIKINNMYRRALYDFVYQVKRKSVLYNLTDISNEKNNYNIPREDLIVFTQRDKFDTYFKTDNNEPFYYEYSSDGSIFLNSLMSNDNEVKIFDIKTANNNVINKNETNNIANNIKDQNLSIFSSLYDYSVNILRNSFLYNLFDFSNFYNNETEIEENSYEIKEKELNDDHFYLTGNSDGKNNLLKLFESTLKVFMMVNSELQENKMQEYLNLLKSLILLNAENFWDNIENSNLIIQAVQSLLKVAETVNKSIKNCKNPKALQIQLSTGEPNPENVNDLDVLLDEEDQSLAIFTGRISFENGKEGIDFHSSKGNCSHESDIEISENETEEHYLTADEGYDADAEIRDSSDNINFDEIFSSYKHSSSLRTNIIHEGLCKIIIEILFELSKKCIDNPNFWTNSLLQLANRLFAIRQSLGGSLFLLKGFTPILKRNEIRLKELQQGILDLITDLNTPDVLSAYLGIMASKDPPIEILMEYICTNNIQIEPKSELIFPIYYDNTINSTCNPLVFEAIEKIRNYHEFHCVDSPFINSACILPITHGKTWTSDGFTLSTWLQIKSNPIYAKLNNSLQSIEETKTPTHILSFGTNQIMLSIFINHNLNLVFETSKPNDEINVNDNQNNEDEEDCGLIIRRKNISQLRGGSINSQYQATTSNKENYPPINRPAIRNEPTSSERLTITNAIKNTRQILKNLNIFQQSFDDEFKSSFKELKSYRFIPNRWTHLCVSVEIRPGNLNIIVTLNGFEQHSLSLTCNNLQNLIKTETFQVACLGQIIHNGEHQENIKNLRTSDFLTKYGISNLLIFDNAFSNKSVIANLTALGPDATNLIQCQIGNIIPNFRLVNMKKICTFYADNFNDALKLLRSRLIASYSSFQPSSFNGFERRVDNSEPTGCKFGIISFGSNLETKQIPSLQTAAILCGGLSSLLFLFARVVEFKSNSNTQALALDLFLHVALSDSILYTEFVKKHYLNLIHYVIRTDQCSKDINLLRSIINNSCTEPILVPRNETMHIHETTSGCIIYPNIVITVLRRYCDWYRCGSKDSKVLDCLLKCIKSLIRDKHPYKEFNIKQLSSAGLIKEILNLCKIYIIESPNPVYISTESADLIVQILSNFAGSPPLPSMLDEIMKLLLLLQRPSECYVTDDRSKIYFLVTAGAPNRQKKISLPLPSRHLRYLIKERKKSTPSTSASCQSGQRRSVSREPETSDKIHPSFSRISVERQPANFSNVLKNVDTLESIADCSKLSPNSRKSLNLTRNITKAASCSGIGKSRPLQKYTIRHNSFQENKNRIQKVMKNKIRSTKSVIGIETSYTRNKKGISGSKSETSDISSSELNILFDNDYEVVNYDEILNIEKTSASKLKKNEFYNFAGIIKLQENLFLLLRDFILILPDNSIEEVLTHYVKMEILIVLSNHESSIVRTSIIRLIAAVCTRINSNDLLGLSKKYYWHHLANQISTNHADYDLCETLIQWITGKVHKIADMLLIDDIKIVNKYGVQAFLAILPRLINSSYDTGSKAFLFLRKLYENDESSNMLLIDFGILQTSCKTLHKLYSNLKSVNIKFEQNIILLLCVIAERSFKSIGPIIILWDIMTLLTYFQESNLTNVKIGFSNVQAKILLYLIDLYKMPKTPTSPGNRQKVSSPVLPNTHLSLNDIKTRFDILIDRTVQFFISSDSSLKPSETEINLFERVVSFAAGTVRYSNFLVWGLIPCRRMKLRLLIVNNLWLQIEQNQTISCDSKMLRNLLWLLLKENKSQLGSCENLLNLCQHLNINKNDEMPIEIEMEKIELNRDNYMNKQKPMIHKIIYRYEAMTQNLIESSMTITRVVAELQNSERKSLMCQMKERDESYIYQEWISLIERMTHEGAPWFNDNFFSRSWELDDTEGPARIRTRLRRCSLDLDRRFVMEEYHAEDKVKYHPLDYLIANGDHQMNITLNSQILYNFPAKYLPVDGEIDGELVITDLKIYFLATYRCKFFHRCCDINRITEMWPKRFQHQECGIEIFLDTNHSLFFALQNQDDFKTIKDVFSDKIMQMPDQNKILSIAQDWKDGLLTNWEYLTILNQMSGRTYNDLMQYPIFPWILSNYTLDILDLTDPNSFRKLEKPIAIQHEQNERHYIANYAYLNSTSTNFGSIELKPYHYSSHYSNSGTVLHFLVRVPPFTSFFLRYQDNNFDLPDRTFHSLNTTWCLASRDSATDVKELIPEFFCLPEMFENFEKLNFGNRQSGEIVSNVQLPPWCLNDARLFILIHRQALESEYVRNNIHNWIDLIFGYKQTGAAAVNAVNVFHPATYPDFLSSKATDPIEQKAVETMVKTYGQMPKQLLKNPHPLSKPFNYQPCKVQPISTVTGLKWGAFTGSPQLSEPELVNIYKLIGVEQLIPFQSTNVIYGLSEKCCVMRDAESDVFNIISWSHDNRLLRIQTLNDYNNMKQQKSLIYNDYFDEISTCGTDTYSNALWLGRKSGRISVYQCVVSKSKFLRNRRSNSSTIKLSYNSAFRKFSTKYHQKLEEFDINKDLETSEQSSWIGPINLIRHTDEVTCLKLSYELKITVSAAKDGLAVIWDLNSFNYIRTIERPSEINHSPISLVLISPSLGDILTLHSIEKNCQIIGKNKKLEDECFEATEENLDGFINIKVNPNGKSILRLHSINAQYINHIIHEEKILCACYSNLKEGIGINVVATAFEGGTIRFWSSWNLSFIKEFHMGGPEIISLTFSTYQYLVTLTKEGYIKVWKSEGLLGNPPKFPQISFNK